MHTDKLMLPINRKRLIGNFVKLVKIKSPSGQEEKISKELFNIFSNLKIKSSTDQHGNLIMSLPGAGKPIILCAHMDTTSIGEGEEIRPIINKRIIKSDGKTILGADNKDSISAIIEALTVIKETGTFQNRAAEIIITKGEELISQGAKNLDLKFIKGKECIISDSSQPYGTIVLSAPHCFHFKIEILGRRSHAKDPSAGIDVNKIISKAVASIPLGLIDKKTTSNIAFQAIGLKGLIDKPESKMFEIKNSNRNTIPDFGIIAGEVRGIDIKKVSDCLKKIKHAFKASSSKFGGKSIFRIDKLADGYSFNKKDLLIKEIGQVFKDQKIKTKFSSFAEGSDANIFNKRGIKTVVISSAHRDNHKKSEYLIINDLIKLTDFYIRILEA